MEGLGKSRKIINYGWSFLITRLTFVGLYVLSDPVQIPFLWTLDFGFWIWDLDLGPEFGIWIWDLDLGLGFGTWIWDWTWA